MSTSRNDHRRRRVVYDETIQASASENGATRPGGAGRKSVRRRKYSSQALQSRSLYDLIPQRWLTVTLIGLGALCLLAVLNLLHWMATSAHLPLGDHLRSILYLDTAKSLSTWCLSTSYIVCCFYCLLTFGMRQHRRDDYRGLYRVWILFAAAALIFSIHIIVDLDRAFFETIGRVSRVSWLAPWSLAAMIIRIGFAVAVLIRLVIEIRACKTAVCFAVLAAAAFGASAWLDLPSGTIPVVSELQCASQNLSLLAAIFCLMTTIVNARFVCQDAFGLAKSKSRRKRTGSAATKKTSRRKKSESSPATKATSTAAPAPATLPPLAAKLNLGQRSTTIQTSPPTRSAASSSATAERSPSSKPVESTPAPSVSKAERKRLKKLRRQERRAA